MNTKNGISHLYSALDLKDINEGTVEYKDQPGLILQYNYAFGETGLTIGGRYQFTGFETLQLDTR